MANSLYGLARSSFLDADIDWSADNIKVVLVDKDASTGYVPNLTTDQFLAIIPAGCRIATSGNLATKTSLLGVADADDITYLAVAAGGACEYLVIYQDTGVAATSRLIGIIDTATGLPVTPGGGDITVVWDSGANKIFKL